MQVLKPGATGPDVRALQVAINERARARGLATVEVDGVYGPSTERAARRISRALGSLESTIAKPGISKGEQRIIRWPKSRTPAQIARARSRAKAKTAVGTGPAKALAEAARHVGKNEQRNMAWVQSIITACGGWTFRVPWCGCYVHHCLKAAGVPVTGRCASVSLILQDALAGRNGFESCVYRRSTGHGSLAAIRPGDVLGMFGESTHTCLAKRRVPGGWITNEGNTSADNQANGRACEDKFRPDASIVYGARPAYRGA